MPIGIVLAQRAANFDAKATAESGMWAETWSRCQRSVEDARGVGRRRRTGPLAAPMENWKDWTGDRTAKEAAKAEWAGDGRSREKASARGLTVDQGQTYLAQPEETRGILSCANQVRTHWPGPVPRVEKGARRNSLVSLWNW